MRLWPGWLILCVAISGCDGAATASTGASASVQEPAALAPPPPQSLSAGSLALYPNPDNDDAKLVVGARFGDVDGLFSPPSQSKHIVKTPLPKGLSPDDYMATGWELGDGTEGAGFISDARTKRIVAAIVRQSFASASDADARVEAYRAKTSSLVPITRKYGDDTYTFWEEGNNRLMILEAPGKGEKVQVTLGLGIKQVLDFLHADPDHARIDSGGLIPSVISTKGASSGA